ncbi:hypothetical protein LA324_05325 [Corynebacterium coyleae]|uniref:hypothetical protein n=1 Tax=Corynebacterium coyleae TaxID=53374 RepID=UPI001CCC2C7E|nr:hypothetical protein [Corynebacterium coyleae]UBI10031.1 hypothetical protein LA324_05325 [Corynebacterium coyleae]
MITLNTAMGAATVEVHPQPQDDGTVDSTVEFHITPGGEIKSFDWAGYKQAMLGAVPALKAMNMHVYDYTQEEYPAVVVEFWEFDLDPDEFDEDEGELSEYLASLIDAVNSVDIEEYITRA